MPYLPEFACAGFASVCALFAATALRAGETTDGKAVRQPQKRPQSTRTGSSSASAASLRTATTRSSNRNTGSPAISSYGGIQDLHLRTNSGKDGTVSVDGHAIWDTNDYDIHTAICRSQSSVTSRPVIPNFAVGTMATADFFRTTANFFPPPFPGNAHRSRGRVDRTGLACPELAGNNVPLLA